MVPRRVRVNIDITKSKYVDNVRMLAYTKGNNRKDHVEAVAEVKFRMILEQAVGFDGGRIA
jgi:hypothetical protein